MKINTGTLPIIICFTNFAASMNTNLILILNEIRKDIEQRQSIGTNFVVCTKQIFREENCNV